MSAYPEEFEEYWLTVAIRNGRRIGKRMTFHLWEGLVNSGTEPEVLLRASAAYTKWCEETERPAKDPERFLKNYFWEDFTNPPDKPEEPDLVTVDLETAQEYWTQQNSKFALKMLVKETPPEWVFRIPKQDG
jgi:hypothetical protein